VVRAVVGRQPGRAGELHGRPRRPAALVEELQPRLIMGLPDRAPPNPVGEPVVESVERRHHRLAALQIRPRFGQRRLWSAANDQRFVHEIERSRQREVDLQPGVVGSVTVSKRVDALDHVPVDEHRGGDAGERSHRQRLLDQDLVEDHSACGRTYYTVLPAGRELLGDQLQVGPGQGDIGEKTPHKVGVRLLELWLEGREDVARIEPYYEHADDTVFDVAGFDASGCLVWVGEAELPSNNARAVLDDYDKLSAVDADAVWAVRDRDTALEVLDRLADADRIDESVSGRDARSFSTIRDTVRDFDAPGMTTVRGFKNLDREVSE